MELESFRKCCDMSLCLIITVISATIYLIYRHFYNTDTWEKYGVKAVKLGLFNFRLDFVGLLKEHGDTVGLNRRQLILLTRDLNLLRKVLVKDFNDFVDRNTVVISQSPIDKSLFFLGGQDWKRVRQTMSPAFSSGKLKDTTETVQDRAKKLSLVLEQLARTGELLPVKHVAGQFTSEIIARMAFGLDTNCLGGEDDEFTSYSKKMFKARNMIMTVVMVILSQFKWLQKFLVQKLNLSLFDSVCTESNMYFNSVLHKSFKDRLDKRHRGELVPNDFFQCLVDAHSESDHLSDANDEHHDVDEDVHPSDHNTTDLSLSKALSEKEVVAQSMLIIFAGFETTATTLQMCLYMLARHPDIQEKVFQDIQSTVKEEVPTRDELSSLTYMEQFINETLRHYPPVPIVSRKAAATRTYGSTTIPKGSGVLIPISAILMDAKHFPDPEVFDPNRFSEKISSGRDPMAFMPFGYGPRMCIGMRLAYLELKIALIYILRKMKVELNNRTEPMIGQELKIKGNILLTPDKPIQLSVLYRNMD
ncbi:hypothetical protein Btru_045753 [Bulinus truncatus]|nr:hypothetical protein Btru_045753 [Bulinus truncatus]